MPSNIGRIFLFCLILSALARLGLGQSVTTSGLTGFVTGPGGKPIQAATVVATYLPTGSRYTTATRAGGQYTLTGLQPGGPYSITVSSAQFPSETEPYVFIELDKAGVQNFSMGAEVQKMAAVEVTARSSGTPFDSLKMSTGTSFDARDISDIVSIRRDPQDIAALDPRVSQQQFSNGSYEYQLQAQGQNYRYNSFLIDGVQANDSFGLNNNGYSSLRSPIAPDWIEAISVELDPYDVQHSGFTGELTSVVLKSGTNDYHGSAYFIYTGDRLRGPNPVTGAHEPDQARTWGISLGGPIVKDKLFFFVGYDEYRQVTAAPTQTFIPDPATLLKIEQTAQNLYQYDPGTDQAGATTFLQKDAIAKIDWNINDDQKLTFTFRHNAGQTPNFVDYNTSQTITSLSNHWIDVNRVDQSYALHLDSDWSRLVPNLQSDIAAAYSVYNGTAKPNGTPFPEVAIEGVPGVEQSGVSTTNGTVGLGTSDSYQFNAIHTRDYNGHLYFDYSVGDHTFKAGFDSDKTEFSNLFVQYYYGEYIFYAPSDWYAGTPTGLTLAVPSAGDSFSQTVAHWSLTDFGAILQDTWRPDPNLTILAGLRYDDPYVPNTPTYSPLFQSVFGFPNNTGFSGNSTLAPRLGFNYQIPVSTPTQVHGGVGLFQGENPAVWLSNPFSNAGTLSRVSVSNSKNPIPGYTFNPNPYSQTPPPGASGGVLPVFNVTDPNFKWPSSWKANLAVDRTLPWLGMILTLEADDIKVDKAAYFQSLNIAGPTSGPLTMPDGRQRFAGNITPGNLGAGFPAYPSATSPSATTLLANKSISSVYYLTNTDQGGEQDYTIEIKRPMKNHWAFSLAYTHEHATDVADLTSSTAQSNYSNQAVVNPNDNKAYISDYDVPDRFVMTATREFSFFKRANSTTTVSLQGIAQTGHPYSFVFKGDANGDGISSNDLFYVPTGPNDPKVTWASASEEASFFQFLAQTPKLAAYAGSIVPRNSAFSPWEHFLNLHVSQQIPLYGRMRLEAFADMMDFLNLIDRNWGQISLYDFPYVQTVAGTTYNAQTGQYQYTFNNQTLTQPTVYTDARWQLQVGVKLSF